MSASTSPSIAIIGAGIGGISLALELNRRGVSNYTIYELEDGVGGTWFQNRYPGCRCDVEANFYSHSRFPNPYWTETHPLRAEILTYWQNLVETQGITKHVKFCHAFVSATWVPEKALYKITLRDMVKNETFVVEHQILVNAIGGFPVPLYPKIEGSDVFTGMVVHAARWPWDLHTDQLRGKNVVVVGNGCSGAQIISTLGQDEAINVVAVARSAHWYIPNKIGQARNSVPYSEAHQKLWARWPIIQRLQRIQSYCTLDVRWLLFPTKRGKSIRDPLEKRLAKWMRKVLPDEIKDKAIPDFPAGAKRFVYDDGYIAALNKPQVKPVWGSVATLTRDGVKLDDGREFPADYVVFSTGFAVESPGLEVEGSELKTTDYKTRADFQQYKGVAMPGIPNYFTMLGNNTAAAHMSIAFILEIQSNYIAQCIQAMCRRGIPVLDARPQAAAKYNAWIDRRTAKTVWVTAKSYFRADGGTGRVFTHYPGPVGLLWWQNRVPEWSDWRGAETLAFEQRLKRYGLVAAIVCGAIACMVYHTPLDRALNV